MKRPNHSLTPDELAAKYGSHVHTSLRALHAPKGKHIGWLCPGCDQILTSAGAPSNPRLESRDGINAEPVITNGSHRARLAAAGRVRGGRLRRALRRVSS